MKKIVFASIFSLFLFSFSFAERYPIEMEYSYIKACSKGNSDMEKYCICTLKELEKRFSLNEFIRLSYNQPEKLKKILKNEIVPYCVDKYLGK